MRFSYDEYRSIISGFKSSASFYNKYMPDRFAIVRHDVEFSIDRALDMAHIDSSIGISSTFFFQVRSAAYNPLAVKQLKKITLLYQ